MGCERDGQEEQSVDDNDWVDQNRQNGRLQVNPGLGIAVAPGLGIYKEILDYYGTLQFKNPDGSNNMTTIVDYTMAVLRKHGLKNIKGIQKVDEITIYPREYFSPKNIDTKELTITPNTHSIHHYDASWAEWYDRASGERGPKLKKVFGEKLGGKINVVIYVFQRYGFLGVLKKIIGFE
jgi:hypothetical protein